MFNLWPDISHECDFAWMAKERFLNRHFVGNWPVSTLSPPPSLGEGFHCIHNYIPMDTMSPGIRSSVDILCHLFLLYILKKREKYYYHSTLFNIHTART